VRRVSNRESDPGRNGRAAARGISSAVLSILALLAATPGASAPGVSPSGASPSGSSASETQAKTWSEDDLLKLAFSFSDSKSNCQMALTRDSVGILKLDPTAGALEPDDENGFDGAVRKRALTAGERDTADQLLNLTRIWKGRKRYTCPSEDGYAFTLWSDSLTLHCGNCFSCTEGVSMPEARMLARFGKLSLWVYRLKGGMDVDLARD
jgi:hypothetical protein